MALHLPKGPHWLLPVAAVCLVMGALLAVQVRSSETTAEFISSRRTGPLGPVVANMQQKLDQQGATIADLQKKVGEYERTLASESDRAKALYNELMSVKIAAGLTEIEGPGIVLELDDSRALKDTSLGPGPSLQALLVHDYDLLFLANELWDAGAEAVSLNGHRLLINSAIRCVGNTIQVNDTGIAKPYRFVALGDPRVLTEGLNLPGGKLEELRAAKFVVRITKEKELQIPAAEVPLKFNYARPVVAEAPVEPAP